MTERTAAEIKEAVRERYSAPARQQLEKRRTEIELTPAGGGDDCCGADEATATGEVSQWAKDLYSADELGSLPEEVSELSLGCGNPTAIAELRPGETILDLGSGSGLDCFLSAKQVGEAGRVIGLDMNDDMLELAQRNLAKVGAQNVEFRKGDMESMPLGGNEVDVIISNCVINLSPDKDAVFRESFRVLKPGGRIRVSDIVWTRPPTAEERDNLASWTGCIAGALEVDDYRARLQAAGFVDVKTELKGDSRRGYASAYVSATKPDAVAAAGCCPDCG